LIGAFSADSLYLEQLLEATFLFDRVESKIFEGLIGLISLWEKEKCSLSLYAFVNYFQPK